MKRIINAVLLSTFLLLASVSVDAQSNDGSINVLFLTKSSGYEHGVVKRKGKDLSHAGRIMKKIAENTPMNVMVTKDAGKITPELLKKVDVVQFYTTGSLFKKGNDGNPPMTEKQALALLEWIRNGGAFVGVHSATDTFKNWSKDGKKPYIDMVGARLEGHDNNGKSAVMTVKPHATTNHLDKRWKLKEEYYFFDITTDNRTPLTILQTKEAQSGKLKKRDPYMNSWIKPYGKGRVFYTALGHRKDVWTNEKFQKLVYKGIRWSVMSR
jgi:type 1 glutamine amidotransferase